MSDIAFLGLGRMGAPMARRALDAGHSLTVWNRSPGRAAPLVEAGAKRAETPAAAAAGADFVITMLADPAAVEEVLFGAEGVVQGIGPEACLVDMSTVGPDVVRALAGRLPAALAFVDAPVMGSVGPAAAGKLTVLASGDVDRARGVLEAFGTVVDCGETAAASARKLVLNTAALSGVALVGEVLLLADALGVDRAAALDGLASGPLAGAVKRLSNADSDFAVASGAKDLGLAAETAQLPQIAAAHARMRAAVDAGLAQEDIRKVVDHMAGGTQG